MKRGWWWPPIIAGALALHVVVSLIVVYVATSDPSYAVEEDYYEKAVAWDDKKAQDRTNTRLGWSLEFSVKPPVRPADRPTLEVELLDADRRPLTGAMVMVEAFHKAHGDDIVRETLTEAEDGLYRASPAMQHDGRWELSFTVDHDGDHFTHTGTRHLLVEGSWK